MFLLSQLEDTHDELSIEGKPLVQIFDTAEDIDHLLHLLYDMKSTKDYFLTYLWFSYPLLLCRSCDLRRKFLFKVIEVMLRLGNKYEICQLVAEATGHLHVEFPMTLYDWDCWCSSIQQYIFKGIENQNGLLFDIMNLALQYEILSILPVAYFSCLADIVGLHDSCYHYCLSRILIAWIPRTPYWLVKNAMMDPMQCFHHTQNRPAFQAGIKSCKTYPNILSSGWIPVNVPMAVSKWVYAPAISPVLSWCSGSQELVPVMHSYSKNKHIGTWAWITVMWF